MRIFVKKIVMKFLKKCTVCLIEQEENQFYVDKQKKSGFSPRCKTCVLKIKNYDFRKIISYYYRVAFYKLYYHLVHQR